jgi:hypothetical protein
MRKLPCIFLYQDLNPFEVSRIIQTFGIKYAYWNLRNKGATRYETLRAIFFAI